MNLVLMTALNLALSCSGAEQQAELKIPTSIQTLEDAKPMIAELTSILSEGSILRLDSTKGVIDVSDSPVGDYRVSLDLGARRVSLACAQNKSGMKVSEKHRARGRRFASSAQLRVACETQIGATIRSILQAST